MCLCPGQAWSFLSHLPVLDVRMSVKGWWEDSRKETERPLPTAGVSLRDDSSWLDVHADQEYVLQVSLRRVNTGQQRVSTHLSYNSQVHFYGTLYTPFSNSNSPALTHTYPSTGKGTHQNFLFYFLPLITRSIHPDFDLTKEMGQF